MKYVLSQEEMGIFTPEDLVEVQRVFQGLCDEHGFTQGSVGASGLARSILVHYSQGIRDASTLETMLRARAGEQTPITPPRSEAANRSDTEYLAVAIEIAIESRASGNHPFGALLVGPAGDVLLSSGNTYSRDRGVGHAETNVARAAAQRYAPTFLERCTLVTSVEPCCMCAGACYWAGIGTVVYGLSESRLAELTGDNPNNLTLNLSCHEVFASGRRHVEVRGPFPELEDVIVSGHKDFW